MIAVEGSKEFLSWATGISVVLEDNDSYKKRLAEVQGYYLRRVDIGTQAVTDLIERGVEEGPAMDSARGFSIHTRWEETYHKPKSLPLKRWLEIRGYRIPLLSKKP